MLKLLMACAGISITIDMGFGHTDRSIGNIHSNFEAWIEGTAILLAVAMVSGVGAWNDYKKEEQFLALSLIDDGAKKVGEFSNLLGLGQKSSDEPRGSDQANSL